MYSYIISIIYIYHFHYSKHFLMLPTVYLLALTQPLTITDLLSFIIERQKFYINEVIQYVAFQV